jgi:signal transduction histidine kinase
VTSRTRGAQALIEISDTGPGIAAEDLPHIFDPYYSASKKHQKTGTGLGLYISKGIVDAHGGQIRCGSEPGIGTTFGISFPLSVQPMTAKVANSPLG